MCSARESYQGPSTKAQSQLNGRLYDTGENYERSAKPRAQCNGRLYDVHENYIEGSMKPQTRYNGYISTDESEYTTDESDSEADDYQDVGSFERGDSAPSALLNYCDSEYSVAYDDDYAGRRRSATSQELETFCVNDDPRFVSTEAEIPAEAKSLMLSMLASQEDILQTKKQLRNTPVLDNLLGTATPECKLSDVNPELGKLTRMCFCWKLPLLTISSHQLPIRLELYPLASTRFATEPRIIASHENTLYIFDIVWWYIAFLNKIF